jgi:hypothetical protein
MQSHYLGLVPERFRNSSGLDRHEFSVLSPAHAPYGYIRQPDGTVSRMSPLVPCRLRTANGIVHVGVRVNTDPALADAVAQMGQLLFSNKRLHKYLSLYQLYESLAPKPALEFAAVRHALSHAPAALTRPMTVKMLLALFGTKSIDLSNHAHRRVFYQQFGRMLIETDRLLGAAITSALPRCHVLLGGQRFLARVASK